MTVEQRDKYAYELMVKNSPEEAVKQLLLKDKVIEKTQQSYTEEYNLRHKLSFELSIEKDKVLELSNHITLYSSEETMLKKINDLQQRINKAIEYIKGNCFLLKSGNYIDLDKDDVVEVIKILEKGEENKKLKGE